jgi:hypothetical protein
MTAMQITCGMPLETLTPRLSEMLRNIANGTDPVNPS